MDTITIDGETYSLIQGSATSDNLAGGSGDDALYGGDGSDKLSGGSGDDYLDGGSGSDRLVGGSGDDTLDGGAGNDVVNGDAGSDTLIYFREENKGSSDVYDGGSGYDTIKVYVSEAEWLSNEIMRAQFEAYQVFMAGSILPSGDANNKNFVFTFGDANTSLSVSKFEAVELWIDGEKYDPVNNARRHHD